MVKINFKTVQNKLFSLEAEGSETVADLKKKIQETQTFPVENQKLIYSGKILSDTANVDSLNIKEKDFLVVMVSKPKKAAPAPTPAPAAEAPAASTSTPAAPAPSTESAPAPAAESASAPTESAPAAPAASTGTGFGGGSFLSGPELQSAISSMTEMGFERDLVMRAMKASYNNPDRAVEYLMTGDIPETEGLSRPAPTVAAPAAAPSAQAAPAASAAPAARANPTPSSAGSDADNLFAAAEAAMNRDRGGSAPGSGASAGPGAGAGGGGGLDGGMLEQLAQSPQMQQLRQMVQENPALIQPLMQQIATSNPQLAQLINQNPQALYDFLGAGAAEGEGEDDFLGPQVMHVDLTEADAAAVERLEALGFDRQMVLQAYMLCDKNEELAANFLFDSGDDEMA